MTSSEELREELRRQAQALPDAHPLTLDDVRTRARRIRRRRYAVTGLAAAAVLAVAVPFGLAAGGRLDRPDRPVGPVSDPVPSAAHPRQVTLTSDADEATAPPALAYFAGDAVHLPDGASVPVTGTYDTLVPLDDSWLAGGGAGNRKGFAAVFNATGQVTEQFATLGRIGVSADGSLAAYVRPEDGLVVTIDRTGARDGVALTAPDSFEVKEPFTIAAVHPCSAADDCLLLADVEVASRPVTLQVDRDRTQRVTDFVAIGDRYVDGTTAGRVTSDEPGTVCSAVRPPEGPGWDTCSWELGRFSPDGRFVLGYSLGEGAGSGAVALLDARDGTLVREFAAREGTDVFVRQAVWESARRVLATVWDTDHWSVMRMGLDGSLANVPVEGLEQADEPDAPVYLAARPS